MREIDRYIPKNHFGSWLHSYLSTHNIDISHLSKISGICRRDIKNWILGVSHPKIAYYAFLIRALCKITQDQEQDLYVESIKQVLKDF